MWFWKYDILLCILFTFQYHMHVLIYLLHYISSLYLSTEHWAIIAEALHTEKFSIIDNANKILVIVNNGIFTETGARMYDLHDLRELYSSDAELLYAFTGRNRIHPNNTIPPNSAWTAVLEATKTAKRSNGIQRSTKFLRQLLNIGSI